MIILLRGSCQDVEARCEYCGVWLGSPLVVEDRLDDHHYRFIAWRHWNFKRSHGLRRLVYFIGTANGPEARKAVDAAFTKLDLYDAPSECLGSYRTVMDIRPASSGGPCLPWGSERGVFLRHLADHYQGKA